LSNTYIQQIANEHYANSNIALSTNSDIYEIPIVQSPDTVLITDRSQGEARNFDSSDEIAAHLYSLFGDDTAT
jgi:hypothetical protein